MSVSGTGLLTQEPTQADRIRSRLKSQRIDMQRQRAVSGVLWVLSGILSVLAAAALALALGLNPAAHVAAGLSVAALWCGVTAVVAGRLK